MNIQDAFIPQEKIETSDFIVRKLLASDAEMDLGVVNSSVDIIKKQRGGTWPSDRVTLAENTIDLENHEKEFDQKSSFAYVIVTKDGSDEIGCIYFYQPGSPMNDAAESNKKGVDAVINFWVSQKYFDLGYYDKVYGFVEQWLKSWPFEKPFISNPMKPFTKL